MAADNPSARLLTKLLTATLSMESYMKKIDVNMEAMKSHIMAQVNVM